ncbi:MAG: hypothetical protein CMF12_13795 [Idiomarina sp.]|uniref:hypothetical protein n=1 Tax=Idiomarina sp. TaxID=1874361 RepID=UPI000C5EF191|nr:hypothetical protein [Idiomarina sp.]MBT43578.1 hypothetical protein [Idiomarina sp.]|tara:strand:+ start:387 stop:602 length:216 start_codon:yes stop_codon:yes gene_type:complete
MDCAVIEYASGKKTMFRHSSGVERVAVGYEGRKFRAKVTCGDGTEKKFEDIHTAYKADDLTVVCQNAGIPV